MQMPNQPAIPSAIEDDEAAPTPYAAPPQHAWVCYRNATLIDVAAGIARPAMSILVEGDTIQAVIPDGELRDETVREATVVDLTERFVMPGLIDSHQHLATPPNRPVAEARLCRQIYAGVTAVRDMADDLRHMADLSRATLVGEIPGPDIYYASLMAGPSFFDDPRTVQVTQGAVPGSVPWMRAITDDTDLVLAVANAVGTSATAIKIYANLPPRMVAAITTEAHRQGIKVWSHGTVFPSGPADVVGAGVDVVSHANLLAFHVAPTVPDSYQDKTPVTVQQFHDGAGSVKQLLEEMRGRGTILDATLSLTRSRPALPAEHGEKPARVDPAIAVEITAMAHAAGVPISTGTDYEAPPESSWPSLHDEMAFLCTEVGMSPPEVLHSATLVGAQSVGMSDVMGTIEEGKRANFVVLARNPFGDISQLKSVDFVVKRGHRFDRSEYAADRDAPRVASRGVAGV